MSRDARKFFPLIPGAALTYRTDGGSEYVFEVLDVSRQSDHTLAQCRTRPSGSSDTREQSATIRRYPNGIFRGRQLVMPFPLTVGRAWKVVYDEYSVTALDATVETDRQWHSGCLQVNHRIAASEEGFEILYYAPWLGLVRQDHIGDDRWQRRLVAHHIPSEIFLSHASEDKEVLVRPLANELTARGFRVWFDERSLQLGEVLDTTLTSAISDSVCAVAVVSPSYFTKRWTQFELKAIGNRLSFAVLHGVTPDDWARFAGPDRRVSVETSSRGIAALADSILLSVPDWMAS